MRDPTSNIESSRSRAAARQRRMRNRRRRGYRVAFVEFGEQDVQALVRAGALDQHNTGDVAAIEAAVGVVLDRLAARYG